MDVTAWLRGVARPCPLVVTAPGGTPVRLAVERAVRELGWPTAASPAETDMLVVCGQAGPGLAAVLEELWRQIPAPRTRVRIATAHADGGRDAAAAARLLTAARAELTEAAAGPVDVPDRGWRGGRGRHGEDRGTEDGGGEHGGGHGEHGGMEMPAGLPMAERAEDRDGLKLDRLHVPLGPVLPDWPAGLVLHTTLQGDVIQSAQAEVLDAGADSGARGGGRLAFWSEPWLRARAGARVTHGAAARRLAAAHLDSLARLLGVAGWADMAAGCRRDRDDLLAGVDAAAVAARFGRRGRRLRRSRTLRWLTDELGALDRDQAAACGLGEDVTARWQRWVDAAEAALEEAGSGQPLPAGGEPIGPRGRLGGEAPPSQMLLDLLPALVTGAELAAARVIVASLDPDLDEIVVGTRAATPSG